MYRLPEEEGSDAQINTASKGFVSLSERRRNQRRESKSSQMDARVADRAGLLEIREIDVRDRTAEIGRRRMRGLVQRRLGERRAFLDPGVGVGDVSAGRRGALVQNPAGEHHG